MRSERNVSQRPPWSLSHYGIHQNPHIHSASKGLLSCKEGVLAKLGVFVDWRVGLSSAENIWLPRLHHWNFFLF